MTGKPIRRNEYTRRHGVRLSPMQKELEAIDSALVDVEDCVVDVITMLTEGLTSAKALKTTVRLKRMSLGKAIRREQDKNNA